MPKLIGSFFTKDGIPQGSLSAKITILEITPTTNTVVINNANMTAISQDVGWYKFNFVAYDSAKNYLIKTDGGNTLNGDDRYQFSGNESFAEDISDFVWDEAAADHTTSGSMGELQNNNSSMITTLAEILKYHKNRTKIDSNNSTLTVYDNDGITPIRVFDLRDDSGTLSITEIFERDPQ